MYLICQEESLPFSLHCDVRWPLERWIELPCCEVAVELTIVRKKKQNVSKTWLFDQTRDCSNSVLLPGGGNT